MEVVFISELFLVKWNLNEVLFSIFSCIPHNLVRFCYPRVRQLAPFEPGYFFVKIVKLDDISDRPNLVVTWRASMEGGTPAKED